MDFKEFHHRAFLGIYFNKQVQDATRDFKRKITSELRNFRFINLEQLHLTLQFLGNTVSNKSLEAINESLIAHRSIFKPFTLSLKSVEFGFPGQRIPTVLFWSLEHSQELENSVREIHNTVQKLGLDDIVRLKDRTKFHSHITIGRTKHSTSKSFGRKIRTIIADIKIEPLQVEVSSISLIKSTLGKNGPSYQELSNIKL